MVTWSEPARDDLKQIHDYIGRESAYYAEKVISTIIRKSEALNEFPQMGRIVPEIMDDSFRELLVYSYRLIYEASDDNVIIHAVIHGKRDFDKSFDVS